MFSFIITNWQTKDVLVAILNIFPAKTGLIPQLQHQTGF
ncbi:hypothetical protein M595_0305 [Lyngbya aestuarii BL J]|uniref:Uncharacterized protein n=1 Tax=Lyngbya aestuarii BL J TaxID=1348334 RepID=U7QTD0_9CYAN|nr:hypothetical protein M595_0305 [Lyngbya aestuarii BL J]